MELLAPVGGKETLKAAIMGGADAVYLAGKDFGARRMAQNFTDEELKAAMAYAHQNKAKVYVAVNTLIKQSELSSALSFADALVSMGADAIIVQDRGLMRCILDNLDVPVHASTQMGIHDPYAALWAEKEGLQRAILSRELSLAQIEAIKQRTQIGLEVFIHGALCYCYSGGCLFSSMLGGRSGNRGLCAQPCRKRYKLGDREGYLLSPADTFGVDSVPELMRIGVISLKIEGRMRSPMYVYYASKIYRSVIDRAAKGEKELITERERDLLETVFNRGFSRGYLMDESVMQTAYAESRGQPLGQGSMVAGSMTLRTERLARGDGITLYQGDQKVGGFEVRSDPRKSGEVLLRSPFPIPDGLYQVYKTKDREFEELQGRIGTMELRPSPVRRREVELPMRDRGRRHRDPELSFYVSSLKTMEAVLPFADRIYYEMSPSLEKAMAFCSEQGVEIVPILPRISPEVPEMESDQIMVCTLGQAERYREHQLYGHSSLNCFNSFTVPEMHQYTLSVELDREDIADIARSTEARIEVMVFGRAELMVTKDPCIKEGSLIDEMGARFQVYRDHQGYAHILNSADTFLLDHMVELERIGVDSLGLDVRRRHPDLAGLAAEVFSQRDLRRKSALRKKCGPITSAHFERGVP